MTAWLLATALHVAAAAEPPLDTHYQAPEISGLLSDARLVELSGLAAASGRRERWWAINDGGNQQVVFLIDNKGSIKGELRLPSVPNVDWEDLARFTWNGREWLLIADIGDNGRLRESVDLWLIREPDPALLERKKSLEGRPHRHWRFRYPDAPHDAESIAVDVETQSIYILQKRVVPARLYRLPLKRAPDQRVQIAEEVARLAGIPQPDAEALQTQGPFARFRSQPTAMAMSCDRRELLVLTYHAIYRYERDPLRSWANSLVGQHPTLIPLLPIPQAEAIAYDRDCSSFMVGSEKAPVPLLRYRRVPTQKQ